MVRLDRFLTVSCFGPMSAFAKRGARGIPILMYHSISRDNEPGVYPYYRTVTTPEVFAQHMALLSEGGYQVIRLEDAVDVLRRGARETQGTRGRKVVITFDDGFADLLENAAPVLARHGYPSTVFLPTAYVGARDGIVKGRQFLSWPQVRELSDSGFTFGSHSVSHRRLERLGTSEVERELRESRLAIEDKTGRPVLSFSYPYAFPEQDRKFVRFLRATLQDCGYACAVTTIVGMALPSDDGFFLRRLPANADDDPRLFLAKLSGGYDWMHVVQYASKSARGLLGVRRAGRGVWSSSQ